MMREYVIFSAAKGGSGIARIEKIHEGHRISIDVSGHRRLHHNEVMKAFVVDSYQPLTMHLIGSLETGRAVFTIDEGNPFKGVALMCKNVESGLSEPLFWGQRKGHEVDWEALFAQEEEKNVLSKGREEHQMQDPPVISEQSDANEVISEEADNNQEEQTPEEAERVADNAEAQNKNQTHCSEEQGGEKMSGFGAFGGGNFQWHKVNGYYGLYSYDVVAHILSIGQVKDMIEETGYYITGVMEKDNTTYVAIALAANQNPFEGLEKYTTSLVDENKKHYVVCCGVDEKGEFFCKLE